MSSSTGLGRTRSIRKPTIGKPDPAQRDGPSARSEARALSPSRLPVKPAMTTRSAAASAAASSSTAASRIRATGSTTGRSVSNVYSKTSTARTDSSGNAPTKPLGRAASTRDRERPPITSMNRTATGRPRSSGGPPPTTTVPPRSGHTRSKSTITSLTPATTLRPISQVSQGTVTSSSSGGRTSPTASTITTSSKIQTRSQTRPRQTSQTQSTISTTQTSSHQPTTQTSSHQPTGLAKRPAFNTHQQHYSPAKSLAPKPLTSTFLAPPSPSKLPANVAISAETSRLQTELLQLSLLHRDAAAVDSEWHASARQKLGNRFARLAKENDALLGLERQGVEARNIAALTKWGNPGTRNGLGLEEKVQILDEVLNGAWQLGEPDGRYARVVAGFEIWAERMASIVTAQRSDNVDVLVEGDEVLFLGDLDASWKRDCISLQRKLEGWRVALRDLGDIESPPDSGSGSELESRSSLLRMVDGCRNLVHDMLSELAVMAQIEQDAARAEDEWIERTNRAIEDEDDDTPAARAYVPLWKLAA